MRLYLVQHGEAVPEGVDPTRPLSEAGSLDVKRLAGFLAERDIALPRVMHSGKLRAAQTAELIASALSADTPVEARAGLGPNDPTEPLAQEVSGWNQDALLVGHLPFLGRLVARLVTGEEGVGVVTFQPGSVVCLERAEASAWSVAWMLGPELLGKRIA